MKQLLEALVYKHHRSNHAIPYRLLKPPSLHPGSSYPLVVFLHGSGQRGVDNKAQIQAGNGAHEFMMTAADYRFFFVAPQCPPSLTWSGVSWDHIPYQMPPKPAEPMRLALALVKELCKAFPVDHNRVYVTGLSMGALGMWDMVTRDPGLFAAGIPICGGYDTAQAARIQHIPFWVFHGSADASVPVEGSRAMVEELKRCGGSPRYTEYKGAGHAIWRRTYGNGKVISWLFQQSREGHLNKRETNT